MTDDTMVGRKWQNILLRAGNLAQLWHIYLRNIATERGILENKIGACRFILLARSRTGSNLLRDLLNAHSQIIVYGELFRDFATIGWDFSYLPKTAGMIKWFQTDPAHFLESRIFGNLPDHIAATGFKLFYYHAHNESWRGVWTYLEQQQQLRVIHVKRRNILKTHLSRKRAIATGRWVSRGGNGHGSEPIVLDYEECLADFVQTRAWEQEYDGFFAAQPRLDVYYEELTRDYGHEMKRVQDFLGVRQEEVKPKSVKQARFRLDQAIVNYGELKERFAGSQWEEFFEE